MKRIAFTVPGRLGGKQRAGRKIEYSHAGKAVIRSFNPHKTESQEKMVVQYAHLAMVRDRISMLVGPVLLEVLVFRHHPKSWTKRQCATTVYVTGKPDYDNQLKLIGDALEGCCYSNDTQIAASHFLRQYRADGPEEVLIAVSELDGTIPYRPKLYSYPHLEVPHG